MTAAHRETEISWFKTAAEGDGAKPRLKPENARLLNHQRRPVDRGGGGCSLSVLGGKKEKISVDASFYLAYDE